MPCNGIIAAVIVLKRYAAIAALRNWLAHLSLVLCILGSLYRSGQWLFESYFTNLVVVIVLSRCSQRYWSQKVLRKLEYVIYTYFRASVEEINAESTHGKIPLSHHIKMFMENNYKIWIRIYWRICDANTIHDAHFCILTDDPKHDIWTITRAFLFT